MNQQQETAARLYPIAALYLGSLKEARPAVIEAVAAAERKQSDTPEQEALVQLLRIAQAHAPERVTDNDFPADSPLLPLLRLTASGRRNLALYLSDIAHADAAAARQISAEEFEQKAEKALRQLTFLQNGEPQEPETLRAAMQTLRWSEADAAALQAGLETARAEQQAAADAAQTPAVREISHKKSQKNNGKTITVPLWTIIAGILCIVALGTVMILNAVFRNRKQEQPALPADSTAEDTVDAGHFQEIRSKYLTLEQAQKKAASTAGCKTDEVVFLNTKLKPNAEPPYYELTFQTPDGGECRTMRLHAENGSVLATQENKDTPPFDTENWLPAEEMRQRALETAGLHDVLFLKESRSTDSELNLYKYELTDADGKTYTIQLEAKTGALVKYTVEEPQSENLSNMIPVEEAKKKALSRVGDYQPEQVVFTKTKFQGAVYTIAFTLDDGTQYSVELNAKDGKTNTVDVHPVSADTSRAIGLLRARDTVLEKAGLTGDDTVKFTKAKIDRNNGAYVYEFEFETAAYEYEVNLKIETGEMIKYRAWLRS